MLIKGVEMLGMVSCFMFKPEYKPAATMMMVSNQIANLFFNENLIIEFKLVPSIHKIVTSRSQIQIYSIWIMIATDNIR
jgi:hypothetical protein